MLMYDVLILATGSVPTEPVLNAVQPDMAMRTRELREVGDRLMEAKSVLVVGGGHIGAEVAGDVKCFAAMAGNEGCTVTLVQKRKRLVPEYGVSAGEMLKERLHKLGVCVRLGCVAVPLGRRRRPGKEGDHDDDGEPEGEGKEKGNKGCAQKYVIMPTDDVSDADIMHTSPQHGRRPNIATNAATTVATAVENEHQTAPDALNSQNDTDNSSRKQRTIADDNHLTNAHTPISITTPTQSPTPSRTLTRTPPSPSSPPLGGDLIVPDVTFLATGVSPSNPDLLTPSHTPDGWLDVDVFGRLRGCDGSVFAYGDCTRSHPKSAFKAMHNKARLAYNVLAVLDRIREDDAPSMVRERDLYRIVEPPDVAVVTTGPMSGVAKTPVGATSWILPRLKNRTMFVAYARSEIGL